MEIAPAVCIHIYYRHSKQNNTGEIFIFLLFFLKMKKHPIFGCFKYINVRGHHRGFVLVVPVQIV